MSSQVITIDDIRAAGHCSRGAKRWFESYGLDFRGFLKNGIPVDQFLATGDGLAVKVVERTIARFHPDADVQAATGNPAALIALIVTLDAPHG